MPKKASEIATLAALMNDNVEARIEAHKAHELGLITFDEYQKELLRLNQIFDVLNAEAKPMEEQLCDVEASDTKLVGPPEMIQSNQLN